MVGTKPGSGTVNCCDAAPDCANCRRSVSYSPE
jgi:hypothetical protein